MERPLKSRTHLTDLEERFALEFVKCRNKRQAYLAAGYKSQKTTQLNSIRASELFNKPHVRERIRELTDKASEKTILTVAKVLDNFQKVYDAAIGDGDYAAANRAMELYGKFHGMFVEKTESVNKNVNYTAGDLESVDRDIRRLAEAQGLQHLFTGDETKQ
jgi:hypothetical protein